MAQWLGQFSGDTHSAAVKDAEHLLKHAVEVYKSTDEPVDRRKKAKNVRNLAKRLLRKRVRHLKARIDENELPGVRSPDSKGVLAKRAKTLERLEAQLADLEAVGTPGILEEFGAAEALDAD